MRNGLKVSTPEDRIFKRAISDLSVVVRESTLTNLDSSQITNELRVVSLNKTEMIEITRLKNQSVENAGVAFVEGANERNEFFNKTNKQ